MLLQDSWEIVGLFTPALGNREVENDDSEQLGEKRQPPPNRGHGALLSIKRTSADCQKSP